MTNQSHGLHIRDLHFAYPARRSQPATPLLAGIDLDVAPGELVCVLGPSGIGKTTLLRCVAGLERDYRGTVTLNGRSLDPLPPHERRVGMLFQEPALFPHLNVHDNVAFGVRYHQNGTRQGPQTTTVDQWLQLVGLKEEARTPVDRLSGGQRHRVALARTLAAGPEAVLLDEPLASLDRPLATRIGHEIRDILRSAGVPAVWVTHDEANAAALADRVWHLRGGTLHTEPIAEGAAT